LNRKLAVNEEKLKLSENRNKSLQNELDELKTTNKDKVCV